MNLTQNPNLVIMRDGQLDESYYSSIRSEQRRATIRAAGKEVAVFAAKTPLYTLKVAAFLFNNALEQANEYNRR